MGDRPKVGIGVFIFKEGKLLLGLRKTGSMAGQYSGPGGHLEFGETFEECAIRETREEVGIELTNVRVFCVSNLLHWQEKHYVDIGVRADWKSGEPKAMEEDNHDTWQWYSLDALPRPMVPSDELYFKALKSGQIYQGTMR